jgi:hypothetical protein
VKEYLIKILGADKINELNLNNNTIGIAKSSMTAGHLLTERKRITLTLE